MGVWVEGHELKIATESELKALEIRLARSEAENEMLKARMQRLEDALLRLGGELGGDGVDGATVNAIRDGARAAGLLMEPRCTNCSGTGRLLEDHDGRAGYSTCGACGGKGWLER